MKPEPSQSLIVDKIYSGIKILNIIYRTRMSKEDLKQTVKFIDGNKVLNDFLINGNKEAVYQIAFNSAIVKKHFSFATKYCAFTNPTQYPIYDTVVDSAL